MGTGHAMRCLALAQAWRDGGGRVVAAMAESTPSIQAKFVGEQCAVVSLSCSPGTQDDASLTLRLAQQHRAAWIVVDGYQFGAAYQRALKAAGFKVLFVDDYGHAEHYSADIVMNQNVGSGEDLYANREAHTRLLIGARYCLLRREFSSWRDWRREIPLRGRRVLVTMGGSDPENLTARVIQALTLAKVEELEATVVVGGSNPHFEMLEDSAVRSGKKIAVQRDIRNMAEEMAAADLAVSAAGSTCWELCLMGLPALLVDVADNQTALARELDRRGCAVHVGDGTTSVEEIAEQLNRLCRAQELRQSLSQHSRGLVDGDGANRVVAALQGADLAGSEGLHLRRARADDGRLLWEWANDPETRAASFSPDPISWETHVAWLAEKLGGSGSLIFIAEDETAVPCGQIRFDARPDGDWEVSVVLAKSLRGRGLGSRLIRFGMQAFLTEHSAPVHAFVKPTNAASARAFENAGFSCIGAVQIRGNNAIHFVCER